MKSRLGALEGGDTVKTSHEDHREHRQRLYMSEIYMSENLQKCLSYIFTLMRRVVSRSVFQHTQNVCSSLGCGPLKQLSFKELQKVFGGIIMWMFFYLSDQQRMG